jgi:hypothetical protein
MNIVNNSNLNWNPINTRGPYKIIVTFSEPVNIKKIYFKCTNVPDTSHCATSFQLYPNIYIGNSSGSKLAPFKNIPEPTPIITLNNDVYTNISNKYYYYTENPIINTDTNYYTNYTLIFNKYTSYQIFLSYLNFDINLTPSKIDINNVSSSNNSIDLNINVPNSYLPIDKYNITGYSPNGCKFTKTITKPNDNSNPLFNLNSNSKYTINVDNLKNTGTSTYNINARDCSVNEAYDYILLPHKGLLNDKVSYHYNEPKEKKEISNEISKEIPKEIPISSTECNINDNNNKNNKKKSNFPNCFVFMLLFILILLILYYCNYKKK